MRLLALLMVVGIIAFAYSTRVKQPSSTDQAMAEFHETAGTAPARQPVQQAAPPPPPPAPGPSSGLRRPIDTTRNVLEKVKGRNGDGQF